MRLWPSTLWGNFVVGGAAALFGPALLRPVIVGVVRTGYQVADFASDAWASAKTEAKEIKAEATSPASPSEIQALRDEIAALKAQVKSKA